MREAAEEAVEIWKYCEKASWDLKDFCIPCFANKGLLFIFKVLYFKIILSYLLY